DGEIAEKAMGARGADVRHHGADEVISRVAEPARLRLHLRAHIRTDVGMAGQRAGGGRGGDAAFFSDGAESRFHCNACKSGELTGAAKLNLVEVSRDSVRAERLLHPMLNFTVG